MTREEDYSINGKLYTVVTVAGRYAVYTHGRGSYVGTGSTLTEALRIAEEHSDNDT